MDQAKGQKDIQYNGPNKRTYNTMDQTKEQKDIQYNGPNKRTKGHTIQ
jgi:hypothetical protein